MSVWVWKPEFSGFVDAPLLSSCDCERQRLANIYYSYIDLLDIADFVGAHSNEIFAQIIS